MCIAAGRSDEPASTLPQTFLAFQEIATYFKSTLDTLKAQFEKDFDDHDHYAATCLDESNSMFSQLYQHVPINVKEQLWYDYERNREHNAADLPPKPLDDATKRVNELVEALRGMIKVALEELEELDICMRQKNCDRAQVDRVTPTLVSGLISRFAVLERHVEAVDSMNRRAAIIADGRGKRVQKRARWRHGVRRAGGGQRSGEAAE